MPHISCNVNANFETQRFSDYIVQEDTFTKNYLRGNIANNENMNQDSYITKRVFEIDTNLMTANSNYIKLRPLSNSSTSELYTFGRYIRDHIFDFKGYPTNIALTKFFYDAICDVLKWVGFTIEQDDGNFGFKLFNSWFYCLCLYDYDNLYHYCMPFIFQQYDHGVQMNSFKNIFPKYTEEKDYELNFKTNFALNNYYRNHLLEIGSGKVPDNVMGMAFTIDMYYNDNYVIIKILDKKGHCYDQFCIIQCDCFNKKILYTSQAPIVPYNFYEGTTIDTTTHNIKKVASPVINLKRTYNTAQQYSYLGAINNANAVNYYSPMYELTDPELPLAGLIPHPKLDKGLMYGSIRNNNTLLFFTDSFPPMSYEEVALIGQPGYAITPYQTAIYPLDNTDGIYGSIIKQATMFNGTIKVPHVYFCNGKNFTVNRIYEINGKQFICLMPFTLYEL